MIRLLTLIVAVAAFSLTSCESMKKSGARDSCCAKPGRRPRLTRAAKLRRRNKFVHKFDGTAVPPGDGGFLRSRSQ